METRVAGPVQWLRAWDSPLSLLGWTAAGLLAGGVCCGPAALGFAGLSLKPGVATGHSAVRPNVPRTRESSPGPNPFCRAGHQVVTGLPVTRHHMAAVPFSTLPGETERPRMVREKGGLHRPQGSWWDPPCPFPPP